MTQPMRSGAELTGRYRLEEQLGRGGMGEVWRGFDLRLERPVAIKLLRPGPFAHKEALARFRREGKAAARLSHPAIAAVYDVSTHQGQPFLVLELLDGHNLETVLGRNPQGLATDRVLGYGAQIAEGLAAAHAAGVVHRDIKPANLMLLPNGQIKIYDFGIARLHDATRLTSADSAPGTLRYMAPEQFRNEPIDGKADLYALGATLFHLLTGHPPYLADSQLALMGMHLNAPVPSARSIRPGIPPALDACLQTLLAKDPAERPSAATVTHHLPTLTGPLRQPTPTPRIQNLPADRLQNLLTEAEHLARTDTDITPQEQGRLWREIATTLADRDPDHARDLLTEAARDLLAEAERLARTDTDIPVVTTHKLRRRGWLWRRKATTLPDLGLPRPRVSEATKLRQEWLHGDPMRGVRRELSQTTRALAGLHPVGAERLALAAASDDPRAQAEALAEVAQMLTSRDPQQAQRILAKAERIARTDPKQDNALVPVVAVLAKLDPAQAEHLADTLSEGYRDLALKGIINVVIERDPDQAERLAGTIPRADSRAEMLAQIACKLAPQHPDRARTLLTEAERLARINPCRTLITVLIAVAKMTAGQDPRRATELLAEAQHLSLDLGSHHIQEIVEALAPLDVVEAERIARTSTSFYSRTRALIGIVKVQAKHDLTEALYLAQPILQSPETAPWEWEEIVAAVAEQDSAKAEHLARTSTRHRSQASALVTVAKVTAGQDPRRATELLAEAQHLSLDLGSRHIQEIVKALAPLDVVEAERIARTSTSPHHRLNALMEIAKVRAEPNPDHAQELLAEAEHLAHALVGPLWQASTLMKIAQVYASCVRPTPPAQRPT